MTARSRSRTSHFRTFALSHFRTFALSHFVPHPHATIRRARATQVRMRAETAAVPDHALAQALLLRGDEQAFRELYARHTPRLFALVLRIMGGAEHDAE